MMVDVVMLYVDGATAGYRELHEAHGVPFRPCHVRSHGELRYALRSIDAYAPWARRIFLVVQSEGHLPDWLDRGQVTVVRHDDFIPAEVLPTFNQFPIQANLHRIPALGPQFVLWHDDYFLGRPTPLELLFSVKGEPRFVRDSPVPFFLARLRPHDLFARFAVNTARLLSPRGLDTVLGSWLYPHMPLPVVTAQWRAMVERYSAHPAFHATVRRKVEADASDPEGVLLDTLYANHFDRHKSALRKTAECLWSQAWRLLCRTFGGRIPLAYGVYGLRNHSAATARSMRALERQRPQFFCVNDDAYDGFEGYGDRYDIHPASLAAFTQTMKRMYPRPSRFERRDGR